MSHDFTELMKD